MPSSRRTRRPRHVPPAPRSREPYVARDESDLVAMVPLVLGFHPEESVVVLSFGARGFHARVDLPDEVALAAGAGEEVAEMLAAACLTNGATRAAVVVYSADHDRCVEQAAPLVSSLHRHGVDVVDVLRVDGGRWFEPLQGDRQGTGFSLETHRFTARGVFEGQVVQSDRGTLAATLLGGDDTERDQLARAVSFRVPLLGRSAGDDVLRAEARWVRERVARAVAAAQVSGLPDVSTADAARLLAAVLRGDLRDAAWVDLRRECAEHHVTLWRDLVRRCPDELLAPVAGLLALAAYLAGDGALAWCAIDRAESVEPGHSLVRLVADAILRAWPPASWPVPDPETLPLLCS